MTKQWKVPLSDLDYSTEEELAVLEVLRGKWLTMGEVTQRFEQEFADFVGTKHAVAVSNATQALHLACLAVGVGSGDEVVVPSLSFVATANAVLYTGAEVRFADVLGEADLCLSPHSIRKAITDRTKAIMVMHYAGFPCRMAEIMQIASEHNIVVIEDAAHAPGASLNGSNLGTLGIAGCFSFFSNKNLATGEGGMIVTDNDEVATRVRSMRSHGMTSLTWDRHTGHAYSYDVVELGYNYRIDEIRAALGRVQLGKLSSNNERRKVISEQYWELLEGNGLGFPFRDSVGGSAHHIFPILLPMEADRKRFIDSMRNAGVQTSIHYPPIHQFEYYQQRYPAVELPQTEAIAAREVTLPLYPCMTQEEIDLVAGATLNSLALSMN